MSMKILAAMKKRLILVVIRLSQNTLTIQKKIVIVKMKDETSGAAIEGCFGLKPKMYSFLIYKNIENKKVKSVNKNVVLEISHNEYTDELLKNKCIRHSMNTTHSKDDRIQTCEIIYTLCCLVLMTKYIFKTMSMKD